MAKTRIVLEPEEVRELSRRVRAKTVSVRDRQRARIILLAAEGRTQEAIGEAVGVTRVTVNTGAAASRTGGWPVWRMRLDEAASHRCRWRR